jgi:ribonuclease P protein component
MNRGEDARDKGAHVRWDMRLGFTKQQRIRRDHDFQRIFRARCSAGSAELVVYVDHAPDGVGFARLGVRAGKRLGNAVQRNRARRRVKEAFRLRQHELPPLDLVCVIRRTGVDLATYEALLLRLTRIAADKLARRKRRASHRN